MPKCPNCGLETQRTEDWACQWCGYPLLSSGYKKIDKTWKEIKEEREEAQQPEYKEPAQTPPPAEDLSRMTPETRPGPDKRPAPPSRVIREPPPVPEMEEIVEQPPVVKPRIVPKPAPKSEPAPQPQPKAKAEPPVARPEPAPEISAVVEPVVRQEAEIVPAPEPEPVVETALELTVDELLSAYMVNDVAAHERFNNRVLRVTGIVNKVTVNDIRAVYSVFLTGKEISGFRDVECRFTKQYATHISKLKAGQSVTIQGRYFGYVINIILRSSVMVG